ncbi:hemicentin-2 isoform X1 [Oryzias melastigma]|nr:hemicentin-2 isoform X1 [Oryzias melastigma]
MTLAWISQDSSLPSISILTPPVYSPGDSPVHLAATKFPHHLEHNKPQSLIHTEERRILTTQRKRSWIRLHGTPLKFDEKANPMSHRRLIVLLFAGLILIVAGETTSCPIELSPSMVVAKYGDRVSVNCSTSLSNFTGMGWESSANGTGLKDVSHLTWTVDSLTEWGIEPMCYVVDQDEKYCTEKLQVVLYSFPEDISISSSSLNGVMTEGETHNFTCDIPNIAPVWNLTVRWYKDSELLRESTLNSPSKKPTSQSLFYRFSPRRQDNRAAFRCEAFMDLGPYGPQLNLSSKDYSIEVLFGPDINCSGLTVHEGESLEGKCLVAGNPMPEVEWLKNGLPINLSIPLRRNDTGIYTVQAEGRFEVNETFWISVFYGPEKTCQSTLTIPEHTPRFSCSEGSPQPSEIWYKDDEEVKIPETLTRRDAGQYIIRSFNSLSSINFTVNVIILYPPTDIVELENAEVRLGGTLDLKCSSMGGPRPDYSWIYYQMANVMEKTEDGVSHLIIKNATGLNMGSYTCHAGNQEGNVSKTVRVIVKGAKQECPIQITPDTMVLQYQSRAQRATCMPTESSNVKTIYWKANHRWTYDTEWTPDTNEDWDPKPVCHGIFNGIGGCHKPLHYTLYKTPDFVAISSVEDPGSAYEGMVLQLQCDVVNVAPAQDITIRWTSFRDNKTIDLMEGNDTICDKSEVRSPVSVSCTTNITLKRTHNGVNIRCEAQLNLPLAGGHHPPSMFSDSLNISVCYKPEINTTKLAGTVPLFTGYDEDLVCEADGGQPLNISWSYMSASGPKNSFNKTLRVSAAGYYNCTVSNPCGSTTHMVKVIFKEDYLPLIAGFVALTVIIISIIFIFIYSIYYKNTKMRRYSLKNPKLSTHNGNVAHNGWDTQFPMTKLS